ncbi:hypothetical protein [Amaricoccus macauensis]|uniref:hypothetical protein n=1 Tax=Amaricoccus macauensis TaxID=57001 RepID=UPI003C7CE86C
MYQTIQLSSCVSVHGEFVEALKNGDVIVRDGDTVYRGRPIGKAARVQQRNYAEVKRPTNMGPFGIVT